MAEGKNPVRVQQFLKGLNYPANKQKLMEHAKSMKAPQEVIDALNMLPEKDYGSPVDVTREVGNMGK